MVTAATSQEVNQSEGENTHPYDAEVINEWRYTFTSQYILMSCTGTATHLTLLAFT
jgi:hypothetical protein